MNNCRVGHLAESVARFVLLLKGYRLVARNYVTGRGTAAGEVDLIVRRGRTLVFVEVKKRRTFETAAYAVGPNQQRRIRRAAESFVARHPRYDGCDIRFDAFLLWPPCFFAHLKRVF